MVRKVDRHIFGSFMQILVYEHGETVHLEYIIVFFWFIQNQGQRRARSPSCLEEDPNRDDLLVFKVFPQNHFSLVGNVNHCRLLSLFLGAS